MVIERERGFDMGGGEEELFRLVCRVRGVITFGAGLDCCALMGRGSSSVIESTNRACTRLTLTPRVTSTSIDWSLSTATLALLRFSCL